MEASEEPAEAAEQNGAAEPAGGAEAPEAAEPAEAAEVPAPPKSPQQPRRRYLRNRMTGCVHCTEDGVKPVCGKRLQHAEEVNADTIDWQQVTVCTPVCFAPGMLLFAGAL